MVAVWMIRIADCLLLGTIAKPHGTKGSVLLWLRNIKAEDIKKRDWVFVETDGLPVPFFIEEFRIGSTDAVILKLADINTETKAKSLSGHAVYLLPDQLKRQKRSLQEMPSLSGYRVKDKRLGFIGIAGEIADIANNPLLQVRFEDREFLVPVHESIILEVNDKKKIILIDAPEGLFEL
jgi:16S rRNA processing protein RimM